MMDQQLVIDSDIAVALAAELAQLTGKSVGEAVTLALQERVAREREIAARLDRVNRLVDELQSCLKRPVSSDDHNLLYGEDGLPA